MISSAWVAQGMETRRFGTPSSESRAASRSPAGPPARSPMCALRKVWRLADRPARDAGAGVADAGLKALYRRTRIGFPTRFPLEFFSAAALVSPIHPSALARLPREPTGWTATPPPAAHTEASPADRPIMVAGVLCRWGFLSMGIRGPARSTPTRPSVRSARGHPSTEEALPPRVRFWSWGADHRRIHQIRRVRDAAGQPRGGRHPGADGAGHAPRRSRPRSP